MIDCSVRIKHSLCSVHVLVIGGAFGSFIGLYSYPIDIRLAASRLGAWQNIQYLP